MFVAGIILLPIYAYLQVLGLNVTGQQQEPPCKAPYPPRNGSVTVFANNMLVEFRCDPGLFAIGRTFGSCNTVHKYWSIKRPVCVGYMLLKVMIVVRNRKKL